MNQEKSPHRSAGPLLGICLLAVASLAMILRLVGCGTTSIPSLPDADKTASHSSAPAEFLKQMVDKYRQAKAYSDQGRLKLAYVRNGKRTEQSWSSSVQFERPGKLRVEAYNLHLASDAMSPERLLVARVEDAESNNIDSQVVVRPAPQNVTIDALAADSILFSQLTGRSQRLPVQLELLIGESPLSTLFSHDVQLKWLSDAPIEDQTCRRIEATNVEGRFVFWIDEDELFLRRLEYPVSAMLPDLAADSQVTGSELVAELSDATFTPNVDASLFTLSIPSGAKRVRAFVLPPTLASADLLGKRVPPFEFVQLNGEKITNASVQGKITALFWYAHHSVCEKPAQHFAAASKKLDDHVSAFAICTEPPDVGDKAVRDQLRAWQVDLMPARDLKDVRSRVFQLSQLPAVTLLDAEGRFQWMASGPQAVADLPIAVERLLNGEDLAALAQAHDRLLRDQYQRLIASGGPQIDAGIAAATLPKKLKLTQKWKLEGLSPGSVVVDPIQDNQRLLVVAGPRSVWEVTADGAVVAKHELPLPEGSEISALRTLADAEGKRLLAGFSPLGQQVHLFDEAWELLFSYPPADMDVLSVRDVQLGDLDGNGEPELLIAFADTAGLHAISIAGERLWNNRAYVPLLSVAISHPLPDTNPIAYVTGRGGISRVNEYGDKAKELRGWALAHLFTSQFDSATQAAYVGIGLNTDQEPCVVGLSTALEEMWNYPLSGSMFKRSIDFVASGRLRASSSGEWVVGWGDGSLHIISEDGEFDDMFHTGEEIRGVAVLQAQQGPMLVVSTASGVVAWDVQE